MAEIQWTEDSAYARERRRWESQHTRFGPGERPFTQQEFPLMVYKASRPSSGGGPLLDHETAGDASDEARLRLRGYVRGPEHAIALLEAQEREIATLAAERHYVERRMSPQAQAEAARVDDATIQHVPVIPETPIKRSHHKKVEEP